ncbi:hypothetical protein LWI28_020052 [Acer negundo]|uniref:Uncharacterized protein n=1 Tax=Acer negundo TaxID=4023 RepID=A0AAD5NR20_ACENE|nr:hypothetical protein LWI28_020052 [Acer negundo]
MLHEKNEFVIADTNHGDSKHVEFKVEVFNKVQDETLVKPTLSDMHDSVDNTEKEKHQYSITTWMERRQIWPPRQYGYAYLASFELNVGETIEIQEPSIYQESVSNTKSSQWAIVTSEEIESRLSGKFEMKDFGAMKKILALSPKSKDDEEEKMCRVTYASDVGVMMYAMVCTCPDISLGIIHWEIVKLTF